MWERGKHAPADNARIAPDSAPVGVLSERRRAAKLFRAANRVVVLTGAGMSAESGVPTFREAQTGLWAKFNPEELATEGAFRANPGRVFAWYAERLRTVRSASPHAGYHALARLADRFPGRVSVVTQNVDGLHARAGSNEVIELHGSLEAFRCIACGQPFPPDRVLELEGDSAHQPPPECARCGNLIRPGVVWFGETLPRSAVDRAWREAERADVVLVVGTSSLVYPAADLPAIVRRNGGCLIEINPDETPLTPAVDVHWSAPAGRALPQLLEALDDGQG